MLHGGLARGTLEGQSDELRGGHLGSKVTKRKRGEKIMEGLAQLLAQWGEDNDEADDEHGDGDDDPYKDFFDDLRRLLDDHPKDPFPTLRRVLGKHSPADKMNEEDDDGGGWTVRYNAPRLTAR